MSANQEFYLVFCMLYACIVHVQHSWTTCSTETSIQVNVYDVKVKGKQVKMIINIMN